MTEHPLDHFNRCSKASVIVGGQYGSEGKGCAAAWVALENIKRGKFFDIITTNAGAQSGHTSVHRGRKRIFYHLPSAASIFSDEGFGNFIIYLNAGSVIDPESLQNELKQYQSEAGKNAAQLFIHPNAGVITSADKAAELDLSSPHTRVAGTRKGVGRALANKVARSGVVAKQHPFLSQFTRRVDLNSHLRNGSSVLVEVPQGVSLSLNHSPFYPYTTSRDCTPMAAMSDAGIHPHFYGQTMVVLRTFPIRVGNIVEKGLEIGQSGGCHLDQKEITWADVGVEAEITTVTQRVRRVFTFSQEQVTETFSLCRPDIVFLAFCNYVKNEDYFQRIIDGIHYASAMVGHAPKIVYQWGPTTNDIELNDRRVG